MKKKIVTIVGARPQFVKAATISRQIKYNPLIEEDIIHTGQHYDASMSQIFFDELEIPAPKHNLHVGSGNHGAMTGRMMEGIEKILLENRPDAVLVYGDTNSTLAGALAASKLHIKIIHVEAGLRSFNRKMPEEINRVLTDHLSSLLFASTSIATENLKNEGITEGVFNFGDVSHDATLFAIEKAKSASTIVSDLNLKGKEYSLCTLHRAENTDDTNRLKQLIDYITETANGMPVIFPVHPRVKSLLETIGTAQNIIKIDPVGYFDMHALLSECAFVITDSGGLQKEAYFHAKPCITMRDETEWVETISCGWNRLWTSPEFITPRTNISEYGDGDTAKQIVNKVVELI